MSKASLCLVAAKSEREFLDGLGSQDIAVPARTQGRTKEHCERRGAFRLLATLVTADRVEYPASVVHRDKPDFLLRFAGHDIGLEFTEAVAKEEAEIDALAYRMNKSVVLFTDQFKKDMPRRTAAQRRQIIESPPRGGPGWGDDRGVPQWVEWMVSFIQKKTRDLAKPDFDRYAENWLLVYDNLPVPFAQDTPKRWTELDARLRHYFAEVCHYSTVFVDSANGLAELTSVGCTVQPIVDLWKEGECSWSPP
jgi:hypothetical protein